MKFYRQFERVEKNRYLFIYRGKKGEREREERGGEGSLFSQNCVKV